MSVNDSCYALSEAQNDELIRRFMAFYDDGKCPKLGDVRQLEAKFGGLDFHLMEEAIDREVDNISNNSTDDRAKLNDRATFLLDKKQKMIDSRAYKAKMRETAPTKTIWEDNESTAAIGSNQNKAKVLKELAEKDRSKSAEFKFGNTKYEHPFVKVRHSFLDKLPSSSCHKNPTGTLVYLLKHMGFGDKVDKHDTGANWYMNKNLIVASVSQAKMSRDLGINRSTVKRHIVKLIENGDIKREVENRENVYILGYVDDNLKEQFYYHTRPNGGK